MSTKLKIKVTKDILERSKMCGNVCGVVTQTCAIALAVRDIFPKAAVTTIYIRPWGYEKPTLNKIYLPQSAKDFITMFDTASPADRPHLPELEFEIDIPDEVLEQINLDELRPLLINHPTLELV